MSFQQMINTYITICYLIAFGMSYIRYNDIGELSNRDAIIFALAPMSIPPLFITIILGMFFDIDKPIIKK